MRTSSVRKKTFDAMLILVTIWKRQSSSEQLQYKFFMESISYLSVQIMFNSLF